MRMNNELIIKRALRYTQQLIQCETKINERTKIESGRDSKVSLSKIKKYMEEEKELHNELVRLENKMEFIKNVLDIDVDSRKGINHYTIKAMYNKMVTHENGTEYAVIEHMLIDEFDYTWDEIERDGGIAQVNKDLKECYKVKI